VKSFLKQLDSIERLDELFSESYKRPVVIFKHSIRCGVSAHVFENVMELGKEINLVVVQESRAISNEIADRTGHRHHTPQVFVIKDGRPVYHATHYMIKPDRIAEVLSLEESI
jgi:bacillithiol system protein YtxJ